ncbi:MAG: hypothetical protein QG605_1429 [Euryarchaeota archaeon]|nr:hypothetical protein [Euryarchaeota archaeon]
MRKVEPSRVKSDQSLLQAADWLSEAEKNLEAGALRSAVSSAYLAVFHSQKYEQEGALEEEWPMLFDRIRSIRHSDQYSFMAKPTEEEVHAGIDLARRFIERMQRLLRETKNGCV